MLARPLVAVALCLLVAGPAAADSKLGKPTVQLIAAGHGAKHKLRTKPVVGTKQSVVMTMKMDMAMDAGPALQVPKTDVPAMKMTMGLTIVDVDKAGDARYDFEFTDFDVVPGTSSPSAVAAVKASLQKMKGFKGSATVDPRGFTLDVRYDVPAGVDPQVKQMLDGFTQSFSQLSFPFPAEAVGVGARWRTKQTLPINGINLHQTTDVEVTALDGDRISAKLSLVQAADPQPMHSPGLPAGAKLSVVSLKGGGTGELQMDLDKGLLPDHGAMSLASDIKMLLEMAGQKQDMKMSVAGAVQLDAI